jgi:hypothetical protein
VAAVTDDSYGDPMLAVGGQLYWAAVSNNRFARIRDFDIRAGRIRYLARGNSVFASADERHIYIAQTARMLIELPGAGIGAPRRLAVPAGWQLSGGVRDWSVSGGIVVYSRRTAEHHWRADVAIWNPGTRHIRIIGRGIEVFSTVTQPGSGYSLLAWTKNCPGRACRLGITNTATLATLTLATPGRFGFTYGGPFTSGAFSPDGNRLAVLVNLTDPADPSGGPVSVPAIVDTSTGALTMIRAARLITTEDVGWSVWLPGGNWLLVGAEAGTYAVDARTLAARPFSFFGSPLDIENVNFSTTLLPALAKPTPHPD